MRGAPVLAFLLLVSFASAEEPLDPRITPEVLEAFRADTFDDGDFTLPYRIYSPAESVPEEKRPLLLFLHGFGERGNDNQRQLIHGGATFASEEFQSVHRAFVVAPQCPAGNLSDSPVPVTWSMRLRPTSKEVDLGLDRPMTEPMRAVRGLIDHLVETQPIDTERLYVTGLSMGGYGTWEIAAREPDLWAAAAPICGGGNPSWGERLKDLPLWAFHGDADGAVPVERSLEMVAAINSAGGRPILTVYPGVGHDSWTPTFEARQVWDWMFSQRR